MIGALSPAQKFYALAAQVVTLLFAVGDIFTAGTPVFDAGQGCKLHTIARELSPADFRLPLIGLFAGARASEIAQHYYTKPIYDVWC